MATEYEAFVRDRSHVLSGREVVLTLRDLSPGRKKYRGVNVRGDSIASAACRRAAAVDSIGGRRQRPRSVQRAHRRGTA